MVTLFGVTGIGIHKGLGAANERAVHCHRICRGLVLAAELYFAEDGNFHVNAGCVSGDTRKQA